MVGAIYFSLHMLSIYRLILPLLQSYEESGEFSVLRTLWSAIVENILIYAISAALLFVFLIYVAAVQELKWFE